MRLSLGDEVWFIYFDATTYGYLTKRAGTVSGVRGTELLIAGKWIDCGGYPPPFASREAAEAWIAEHKIRKPTAPGT